MHWKEIRQVNGAMLKGNGYLEMTWSFAVGSMDDLRRFFAN